MDPSLSIKKIKVEVPRKTIKGPVVRKIRPIKHETLVLY